jgi:hypothetical protein
MQPLTFAELFGSLPTVSCKRFGPAIEEFVRTEADKYLDIADRQNEYTDFASIMADENIGIIERNWIWIRRAKGFERAMDRIIMKVAVTNFKYKHGHMPTLEDILGDDNGFEDSSNHQDACDHYEEPTWPQDWPIHTRRQAYQTLMDYMAGIYERACAEHRRSRSSAYAA